MKTPPTSSAKLIPSAKQSSKSTGRTVSSLTTSGLLPTPEAKNQEGYQVSRGKRYMRLGSQISLFSSQEDSLVNPLAKPDEEKERKTTATSGLSCLRLYAIGNRHGSSLKTCVESLLSTEAWYSNKCALIWKAQVTKSNRLLFQLSPSTRRIVAIESGLSLIPKTPSASDAEGGIMDIGRAQKEGLNPKIKLRDVIPHYTKMMPTPNARDTRGKSIKRDRVPDIVEGHNRPIGQQTGLKLQPTFVEWMMGFPKGWTEIPDSKLLEMRLFRKSQKKLSKPSH